MWSVRVVCRLTPLEDEEKVREALRQLFPEMRFERRGDFLVGEGKEDALNVLLNIVGREGIGPRFLDVLKKGRRGDKIVFPLDREVATVGRISFGLESELPPIWVEVSGDVEEFVRHVRSLLALE